MIYVRDRVKVSIEDKTARTVSFHNIYGRPAAVRESRTRWEIYPSMKK